MVRFRRAFITLYNRGDQKHITKHDCDDILRPRLLPNPILKKLQGLPQMMEALRDIHFVVKLSF